MPIQRIEVYVHYVRYGIQHQNFLDANITVPAGSNQNLTVQAVDQNGAPLSLDYRWNLLNTGQAVAGPDLQQRTVGVEAERELPYAALQQLCAPALSELSTLVAPQREALEVAFGLARGTSPDRLLVGLATWLIDDARAYANAPEPTDGAHH